MDAREKTEEGQTEAAEDALVAAIREEIETAGHSTVTWGGFERLGGLSEDGAKEWAAGFCARPGVGLRATIHGGGVGFWPDASHDDASHGHLSELIPPG